MTPDTILAKLRAQAGMLWIKRLTLLGFGLPLCLLAPLIMGTIFWIVCSIWGLTGGASWFTFFWISEAVFIPLLFGLEMRTGGHYLSETVSESGGPSENAGVAAIAAMLTGSPGLALAAGTTPQVSLAWFIEMFLYGPRMVLSAINDLRASYRFGKVDLSRAAAVLATLFKQAAGVHPSKVLKPGETLDQIAPAIAYLAWHQWIGVAANADKIWLPSDIRKRLM